MSENIRVRATTVYVIEARLDRGRPWKQITDGVEWPPYKDKAKAMKAAKNLVKSAPRKRI